MSAKKLMFRAAAREKVLAGATVLADAVHRYAWDTEAAITRAAEHSRLHRKAKGRKP